METKIERVKKVFDDSGLSQTQIAKRLDVTPQYIWKMLNNDSEPSERMLLAIEKGFPHINGDWLRTGEGEMMIPISKEERSAEIAAKIQKRTDLDEESLKNMLQLVDALVELPPEDLGAILRTAQKISKKIEPPD